MAAAGGDQAKLLFCRDRVYVLNADELGKYNNVESPELKARSVAVFGGRPDYSGSPEYDGLDSQRIKATDNTPAFLKAISSAISEKNAVVRIPAGHWAIKTGNLAFSGFEKLTIIGDGIDVTVIDFVKEDATHAAGAYVTDEMSNCIASFSNGWSLEFRDLTIKATTKAGRINGAPGSNDVYSGAVWGIKVVDVENVRLTRVRVERFNYRGFSISGANRVSISDCEGYKNTSTGFWVQDTGALEVDGGEYSYNGVFGEAGTGYGITASARVGRLIVKGGYYHHNYRKGLDSHGCWSYSVIGATFENNVLYHLACINNSPPATEGPSVKIKGCSFENGGSQSSISWLKSCYLALAGNGYTNSQGAGAAGCFVAQIVENATIPLRQVSICDNAVHSHYNGGVDIDGVCPASTSQLLYIKAASGDVQLKNNHFNFSGATFSSGGDADGHVALVLIAKRLGLTRNSFEFKTITDYYNQAMAKQDVGLFMQISADEPRTIEFVGNEFYIGDCAFSGATGSGNRIPVAWTSGESSVVAAGNIFSFTKSPMSNDYGLNSDAFLGMYSAARKLFSQSGNMLIECGTYFNLPSGFFNKTESRMTYATPYVTKAVGDPLFYVVIRKRQAMTCRVSTNSSVDDVIVNVPDSTYQFSAIASANPSILFSAAGSTASFVDADGVEKIKLSFTAKSAIVDKSVYGVVQLVGALPSLGIESVVYQ